MGRKHCGKMRNGSLRAISPFPTVFSKDFERLLLQTCKNRGLFGKDQSTKSDISAMSYSSTVCMIKQATSEKSSLPGKVLTLSSKCYSF